jgi:MFS family permease
MNEPTDRIEQALRVPEPMLPDDDFSEAVLARLPPRRRRVDARRWTLAGAAALGSALTLALAPPLGDVVASLSPWTVPPAVLTAAALIAVVAIPALLLFYAERGDR